MIKVCCLLYCILGDCYIPLCISDKDKLESLIKEVNDYDKKAMADYEHSLGDDISTIIDATANNHPLKPYIDNYQIDFDWYDYLVEHGIFELHIDKVLVCT